MPCHCRHWLLPLLRFVKNWIPRQLHNPYYHLLWKSVPSHSMRVSAVSSSSGNGTSCCSPRKLPLTASPLERFHLSLFQQQILSSFGSILDGRCDALMMNRLYYEMTMSIILSWVLWFAGNPIAVLHAKRHCCAYFGHSP